VPGAGFTFSTWAGVDSDDGDDGPPFFLVQPVKISRQTRTTTNLLSIAKMYLSF
jgi:hypothetical protein